MKQHAYILLGSNLGDRTYHLQQALSLLDTDCGRLVQQSSIYESPPWGFESAYFFLNQVVQIETGHPPAELLIRLLAIEKKMGRERTEPAYTSRLIDLDILYFESLVMHEPLLRIPHPRLHLRRFTLLPLSEIAADFVHPVLKLTNAELLKKTVDLSEVKLHTMISLHKKPLYI
jgi:2-amino-4-hydroxy-6-hydroxymethyldihydropteridine diphosphokinase